ncbi:MAG: calcium/sodium antiporter [Kineosporiaceae bacterium]
MVPQPGRTSLRRIDAITVLQLVGGLVALVAGGEVLVRAASGLARAAGLSPLVIGLTVVSSATSTPELAVTLDAALTGEAAIAVGNVVGSNIVNVLLILGVSALVLPLVAKAQLVRLDVPVMIGLSGLTLVLALDGGIGRLDGALLFLLVAGYVAMSVVVSRRAGGAGAGADGGPRPRPLLDLLLMAAGIALLVVGARWLVAAATGLAAAAGLSELVIGLTVVAAGTSLPELATSVIAAVRGQRDIAIGNVVGSSIFNLGAVLGLAAVISPGGIPVEPGAVRFDLPVMTAVAVALLPVVFTGAAVARWEGAVFVGYYAAYVAYLVLDSTGHDAVAPFGRVMLAFVVPLTLLTLAVLVVGEVRRRRAPAPGAGPGP